MKKKNCLQKKKIFSFTIKKIKIKKIKKKNPPPPLYLKIHFKCT
jgi:hypothetical protein